MTFVLDASVALAWHFEDEAVDGADAISERSIVEDVVVPYHWHAEVANGLLVGERRRRTSAERIDAFGLRLAALDLVVDESPAAIVFDRLLPIARANQLTVYDAFYLELAMRRSLPLATFDAALAKAAQAAGVPLLGFEGEAP